MIRALRLTDVLAYLALRNRAARNEALLEPEDNPSAPSIRGSFLGRPFDLGRQSWVHVIGGQVDGLVAARPRVAGDIWDVDQLVAVPSVDANVVFRDLLGHVSDAARDAGVQKVFLRLRSDSPAQLAARRVGFFEYARETIYRLPELSYRPREAVEPFRPRGRAHHQAIFQLYSAAVPCQVREMEGMTLHEWRLSDCWGFRPTGLQVGFGAHRRDFVLERGGKVMVWSNVDASRRRFQLMAMPNEAADVVRAALHHSLAQLHGAGAVTCGVRAYQPILGNLLEDEGFRLTNEHTLMGQSLAIRLPQRQFLPARA